MARKKIKLKPELHESEHLPSGGTVNFPHIAGEEMAVQPGFYVIYKNDAVVGIMSPDEYARLYEEEV